MDASTAVSSLVHATTCAGAADLEKCEFLVFSVGDNDFGVDMRKVREWRHFGSLARIADGDRLLKGVISLNGRVMPLVDLRSHFQSSPLLYDELTDVIVADVGGRPVCIVVDGIGDVVAVTPDQVRAIPGADLSVNPGALIGTVEWEQRPLILMDIDLLLLGPGMGTPPRLAA